MAAAEEQRTLRIAPTTPTLHESKIPHNPLDSLPDGVTTCWAAVATQQWKTEVKDGTVKHDDPVHTTTPTEAMSFRGLAVSSDNRLTKRECLYACRRSCSALGSTYLRWFSSNSSMLRKTSESMKSFVEKVEGSVRAPH
ncbi:hypothetical protein ACJQWK_04594 [Exserohilum turcicum]|uniref:Uncharacterized protein n=1 Tax=Exserohilum turcicum (strain 28A) TaxID=671987 RepID=R0IBF6_EXST2|nr:uncharacterized protein SETTUDRAFT_165077 [Exserohilum turcica Et28A]EOA82586.1 hypothetical protein SETTUDRAFT_165077 [Exserohilum turcica Et28A]